MSFLTDWLRELWLILTESGVWLVGGFLLAGVVHELLPRDAVGRWLSGRGSILRAALVGVPLPLCSCSVIPVAAGLRREGAGKGASAAFAISTPESGVDSIAYTHAVLGPVMAITRPLAALVTAVAAGVLIAITDDRSGAPQDDAPTSCGCAHAPAPANEESPAACCGGGSSPRPAGRPLAARTADALRFGFIDMPRDLGGWLLAGLALSALIGAAMPEGWIAEHAGAGLGPMLLMLVAGMPVYVCATASTPVAAALVAKGLSPGAALVFLLAGPATNMATMAWVAKDLGWRALGAYLTAIALCSMAFGLALDALIARGVLSDMTATFAQMNEAHDHGPGLVDHAFGAVLVVMLGAAVVQKYILARITKFPPSRGQS